MATRRLAQDWQQRHGYRPLLVETFVETPRFQAACYNAANWICVSQTKGRGELDADKQASLPQKVHLALSPQLKLSSPPQPLTPNQSLARTLSLLVRYLLSYAGLWLNDSSPRCRYLSGPALAVGQRSSGKRWPGF